MTVRTSTSILASWQPPLGSRNGYIRGFKLFVKRKGSDDSSNIVFNVSASIHTKTVTGLDKFAEYEFQVLALTFFGDGPKSSVKVARTKEDGKCIVVRYQLHSCHYCPSIKSLSHQLGRERDVTESHSYPSLKIMFHNQKSAAKQRDSSKVSTTYFVPLYGLCWLWQS